MPGALLAALDRLANILRQAIGAVADRVVLPQVLMNWRSNDQSAAGPPACTAGFARQGDRGPPAWGEL